MADSDWIFHAFPKAFQLETVQAIGIFAHIPLVMPGPQLTAVLAKKASLATAIGTEKARAELIASEVLFEF